MYVARADMSDSTAVHPNRSNPRAACARTGGDTRERALEETAIAMFDYMTPLDYIALDDSVEPATGSVEGARASELLAVPTLLPPYARCPGHDTLSLTFNFLDALLYRFATEDLVCKDVRIEPIVEDGATGLQTLRFSMCVPPARPYSPRITGAHEQVGCAFRPATPPTGHRSQGHHLLQHAGVREGGAVALFRDH